MVDRVEQASVARWLCPDPASNHAVWTAAIDRLQKPAQDLAAQIAAIPAVYGLELRTAYLVLRDTLPLAEADNSYWREKTAFLYRRPASEPIALSFWKRQRARPLDAVAALQTASILTGSSARYRRQPAQGQSAAGMIEFESVAQVRSWLPAIAELQLEPPTRSDWPVYVFAKTVMAHPFEDGNGRFARLLFAVTLAAQLRVIPCLALAPSFYRHAERLSAALTTLSCTEDWQPLTTMLIRVVEEAITTTALTLPSPAAVEPDG